MSTEYLDTVENTTEFTGLIREAIYAFQTQDKEQIAHALVALEPFQKSDTMKSLFVWVDALSEGRDLKALTGAIRLPVLPGHVELVNAILQNDAEAVQSYFEQYGELGLLGLFMLVAALNEASDRLHGKSS